MRKTVVKKRLTYIIAAMLSFTCIKTAFAGLEGRIESVAEADNRLNYDSAYMEERADLIYRNREGDLTSGFSGAVRLGDSETDGNIYQLYLDRNMRNGIGLKAGRFERADGSGYYTVDGASVRSTSKGIRFELYGGRPERIEDYKSTSADLVIGGDGVFTGDSLTGRLGYQQFNGNGVSERVMGGIRTSEGWNKAATLAASGTYLPDTGSMETFDAEVETRPAERSLIALSYSLYLPDRHVDSFRERFYREYAAGKEEAIKAAAHYNTERGIETFCKVRQVSHDSENHGYGGTVGAGVRNSMGTELRGEADALYLEGEMAISLYLSSSLPVAYDSLISVEMAVQRQEKRTTGGNNSYGFDAEFRKMLKGNLYLTGYGMYISNSRMDDEYRAGLKVTLYLNGGN